MTPLISIATEASVMISVGKPTEMSNNDIGSNSIETSMVAAAYTSCLVGVLGVYTCTRCSAPRYDNNNNNNYLVRTRYFGTPFNASVRSLRLF